MDRSGMRPVVVARIALVAMTLVVLVLARPAITHATAAGVLLRIAESREMTRVRDFGVGPITRTLEPLDVAGTKVRAYLYERDSGVSGGIVLVHGVHWKSIDEARLVRFARAIAETGVAVLTPEVPALADYRIDRSAVVEIGAAASALRKDLGGEARVGVMGVSFAGSLALLAAADPELGKDIGFVVTVGSYDDLERVCLFFATGTIARPDGSVVSLRPHPYGPLVWVYSHLADFFPEEGREEARRALRDWLHEEPDAARADLASVPEASRKKLAALFADDIATGAPDLAADVERHHDELEALSPHGHIENVHIAVFAVHGSDDHLIPATETLWIAHDLSPGALAYALISPALTHVEVGEHSTFAQRLELVHFLAGVLAAARHGG